MSTAGAPARNPDGMDVQPTANGDNWTIILALLEQESNEVAVDWNANTTDANLIKAMVRRLNRTMFMSTAIGRALENKMTQVDMCMQTMKRTDEALQQHVQAYEQKTQKLEDDVREAFKRIGKAAEDMNAAIEAKFTQYISTDDYKETVSSERIRTARTR